MSIAAVLPRSRNPRSTWMGLAGLGISALVIACAGEFVFITPIGNIGGRWRFEELKPSNMIVPPGTPPTLQIPTPGGGSGCHIDAYDTDGDGTVDQGRDSCTGRVFQLTPIKDKSGETGFAVNKLSEEPGGNNLGGTTRGGGTDDGPGPRITRRPLGVMGYTFGCTMNEPPLDWGGLSAEEWIHSRGFDQPAGSVKTGEFLYTWKFETRGIAEVTLFASTNQPVYFPSDYGLCYQIDTLASQTPGAPAGLQIRARGEWIKVAAWLLDMGIEEIDQPDGDDGTIYSLVAAPDGRSVDVYIEGIFIARHEIP